MPEPNIDLRTIGAENFEILFYEIITYLAAKFDGERYRHYTLRYFPHKHRMTQLIRNYDCNVYDCNVKNDFVYFMKNYADFYDSKWIHDMISDYELNSEFYIYNCDPERLKYSMIDIVCLVVMVFRDCSTVT